MTEEDRAQLDAVIGRLDEMLELLESDTARLEPIFTVQTITSHVNSLRALITTWLKS